ncbi:hypothetical protein P7K49_020749, partial [Saguinus oedipus]
VAHVAAPRAPQEVILVSSTLRYQEAVPPPRGRENCSLCRRSVSLDLFSGVFDTLCCAARRRRGRPNANLWFIPSPLISPHHGEVRRPRALGKLGAQEVCGEPGEQRSGPAGAGRAQRRERGAARRPSGSGTRLFLGATVSPGRGSQMHRLIFVYTLICANFCSCRDTSATSQSASIKALRNANLRRDVGRREIVRFSPEVMSGTVAIYPCYLFSGEGSVQPIALRDFLTEVDPDSEAQRLD